MDIRDGKRKVSGSWGSQRIWDLSNHSEMQARADDGEDTLSFLFSGISGGEGWKLGWR